MPRSQVILRSLRTSATIGLDAWSQAKPQPVIISICLDLDLGEAASTDDVTKTFSYSTIAKSTMALLERQQFASTVSFVRDLIRKVAIDWPGTALKITVGLPKAITRVLSGGGNSGGDGLVSDFELSRLDPAGRQTSTPWELRRHQISIGPMVVACLIGVNLPEHKVRQHVILRLTLFLDVPASGGSDWTSGARNWPALMDKCCGKIEQSRFATVEALARDVASTWFAQSGQESLAGRLGVGLEKPSAVAAADGAGVYMEFDR